MMNPLAAAESVLFKAFNFSGRAPRSEYWWWGLIHFVVMSGLVWTDIRVLLVAETATATDIGYSSAIFTLLMFIPNLSVTVRRLHDSGRSGFWYFIVMVPIVGPLWFLFLLCLPSEQNDNIYGPPYRNSGKWEGKSTGKPDPMQGYAALDRLKAQPTPEMMQARKQEIHDYYRSRVLQRPS